MENTKVKLNILDIVIVFVVICAIAVVIFSDTINETFGEPEITDINIKIEFGNGVSVSHLLAAEGSEVEFTPDLAKDVIIQSSVARIAYDDSESSTVIITCKGYKKLGRFYGESGELIAVDADCSVAVGESVAGGKVKSVELKRG